MLKLRGDDNKKKKLTTELRIPDITNKNICVI